MTLLLVFAHQAALAPSSTAQEPQGQTRAKYTIEIQGLFDADALASGHTVPTDAEFSRFVGIFHTSEVTFWEDGGTASAGLQRLAEAGNVAAINDIAAEFDASTEALEHFKNNRGKVPATGTRKTGNITIDSDHTYLTVVGKISPSPDWFVGVANLDLRPDGNWVGERTIDLYPWDAGTDDGTDFTSADSATTPQGTISSLRNTAPFSDTPIARLTITMTPPPRTAAILDGNGPLGERLHVAAEAGDESILVSWDLPPADKRDFTEGYAIQWISGSETFDTAAADGREAKAFGSNTSSYTITGLDNETEYEVRVLPYNAGGNGDPSVTHSDAMATPTAGDGVLVSNVNQNPTLTARYQLNETYFTYRQGFTTGPTSGTLGSVTFADFRFETDQVWPAVKIYDDGDPGTLLHTLDPPAVKESGDFDATFTVPAGEPTTLAADTTYVLVIERGGGTVSFRFTKDDDEDPQGESGWSIADKCSREDMVGFTSCPGRRFCLLSE